MVVWWDGARGGGIGGGGDGGGVATCVVMVVVHNFVGAWWWWARAVVVLVQPRACILWERERERKRAREKGGQKKEVRTTGSWACSSVGAFPLPRGRHVARCKRTFENSKKTQHAHTSIHTHWHTALHTGTHTCMCVCVCLCVCTRARVCVGGWVGKRSRFNMRVVPLQCKAWMQLAGTEALATQSVMRQQTAWGCATSTA